VCYCRAYGQGGKCTVDLYVVFFQQFLGAPLTDRGRGSRQGAGQRGTVCDPSVCIWHICCTLRRAGTEPGVGPPVFCCAVSAAAAAALFDLAMQRYDVVTASWQL